jgi:hypothetical protein
MTNQIQTNNVNSTELWVELDEQQSSELVGGSLIGAPLVNAPLVNVSDNNIGNDSVFSFFEDLDGFDSNENFNILSILSGIF